MTREEFALVKAALLYGDSVVLLSPSTELILGAASLVQLSPSKRLEVFATMVRAIDPGASPAVLALAQKKRRTPAEIALLGVIQARLRPLVGEPFDSAEPLALNYQAGLAGGLFGCLPTFPQATVEQIRELRGEITAPEAVGTVDAAEREPRP